MTATKAFSIFMNNQRKNIRKKQSGFTLVEVMVTVVVLSVLVGIVAFIMGDTVNSAKDATKKTNAMTMNKQLSQIVALGGSVGDGSGNNVDTTSIESVIESLTKNLNVSGITFSLDPKPIAVDYTLESKPGISHKVVVPKLHEQS